MPAETALPPVCFRTPVFGPVFSGLISVFVHTQAYFADGDAIIADSEIIFVNEMPGVSRIKVYEGRDIFPSAVIIDRISVMCGV